MLRSHLTVGLALCSVCLIASPALASRGAGVWAYPDEVIVAGAHSPQPSVTIRGFMMAFIDQASPERRGPYADYSAPRWGDLHYVCPPGEAAACLQEWAAIAAQIGRADCVGWGTQSAPPGRIQPLYLDSWFNDAYPFGQGSSSGFAPCKVLAAAISSRPPPPFPDGPPDFGADVGPMPDLVFDIDIGATDGSIFDLTDSGPSSDIVFLDFGPEPDADEQDAIDLDLPAPPDGDVGPPLDTMPFDALPGDGGFLDSFFPDLQPNDGDPTPTDVLEDKGLDAADSANPPDSDGGSSDIIGPDGNVLDALPGLDLPLGDGLLGDDVLGDLGMPGDVPAADGAVDASSDASSDATHPDAGADTAFNDAAGADSGAEPGAESTRSSDGCSGAGGASAAWLWALALVLVAATRRRRSPRVRRDA